MKKNIWEVMTTVFLILTLGGIPAFSQEAAEEFKLDEMVVTGTRSEKLLLDVPIRTEVITSEDIEAKGATNLYEALEGIPNVRVEQQCSYCNFSIVRMQGLESGHCQVLINGLPIYSGLAGVYGLQQIPAAAIERIEVVKGASSALYGSSAIAGVINIITKKTVEEEPRIETSVQFGEDATNTYTASASGRLGKNADMLIYVQKSSGDEIDDNKDNITDRVWSNNITAGTRINYYELWGDDIFTLTGNTITEKRKGGELEDDAWENPFAEGSEHIDTQRYEGTLAYQKTFEDDNKVTLAFAYTNHDRNATNDTFVGDYLSTHEDVYPPSNLLSPYSADENNYTADFSYSHPIEIGGIHTLLGGFQYNHNKLDESGMYVIVNEESSFLGTPYKSLSKKKADDYGVFIQDEWSILDNLDLVAGARYDNHDSEDTFEGDPEAGLEPIKSDYDEDAVSPRFALMYKPVENVVLRSSVGKGFRVPYSFSEDLHLCSGSPRVYKGGDLKPEKSWSYNLSADYVGDWYLLSLSLFRTDLKEKIGLADAGDFARSRGFDYQWENIGKAYTQGVELSTQFLVMEDLLLDLYGTYTDAKYDDERADWVESHPEFAQDSKHISRVPELTAGSKLTFSPGDWDFVLDGNWTGRMYIDYYEEDDIENPGSEIVRTDPFWVWNTRLAYNFSKIGFQLFAGVKNLFNKVQSDKRTDDAAFMYAPYTGRLAYTGGKFTF